MSDQDELADVARRLFGREEPTALPPGTARGNYSPREGVNPNLGPGDDLATFTAALFERGSY